MRADALLKSMRIYDLYSRFANASTIVDLPTRRAPSMSNDEKTIYPVILLFQNHNVPQYFFIKNSINPRILSSKQI